MIGKNISTVIPIRWSTAVDGLHGTGESALLGDDQLLLRLLRILILPFIPCAEIFGPNALTTIETAYRPVGGLFPRPLTTVARKPFKR